MPSCQALLAGAAGGDAHELDTGDEKVNREGACFSSSSRVGRDIAPAPLLPERGEPPRLDEDPPHDKAGGGALWPDQSFKDPAKWRAFWLEHRRSFDPKQRLRRGNPYSPSVSLYELDQLPLSPEDRRRLHRELGARTGKLTRFDPHDFVLVQERSLAAWGALVKASAETPGSWGRARGW